MDVVFLLRAQRLLAERQPARLEHSVFVAALAAQQSASATARAQALSAGANLQSVLEDPLIELLLAGPDWKEAAAAQRGCFNRCEGRRGVNGL